MPKLTREYVASDEARKVADDSILNAKTTEELDKVVAHINACFGQADAKCQCDELSSNASTGRRAWGHSHRVL